MIIRVLFLFITAMVVNTVSAAQPSDSSINKLLQVNQTEQMFNKLSENTSKELFAHLASSMPDLTETQRKAFTDLMVDFEQRLFERLSYEAIAPRLKQIYQKHLTQEQVDFLIQTYDTELGQSVLQKSYLINMELSNYFQAEVVKIFQTEIVPKVVDIANMR